METGRLKTIVILILLCVNLAFGGILLSEKLGAAEGNAQTRSELRSVLAGLGITVEEEQIPAGSVMLRRSVARERVTEDRLVTALLGPAEGQDQGGNIWYYENASGWASHLARTTARDGRRVPFPPCLLSCRCRNSSGRSRLSLLLLRTVRFHCLSNLRSTLSGTTIATLPCW